MFVDCKNINNENIAYGEQIDKVKHTLWIAR